jgi:Holliday junction resolvasome RuvABC endonuclease subunit
MLESNIYFESETTFKILCIDPGTKTLGYAVYEIDIETLDIVDCFAWTVDIVRLDIYNENTVATYQEKFARIIAHKKNFRNVLDFYQPLIVVSETPFFSIMQPSAAGPLFELFATLEQTVEEWDSLKPLYKAEPRAVKKSVGAVDHKDKEAVKKALKKIPELSKANLDLLDNHSIDALAVGYYHLLKLRNKGTK